MKLVNIGSRDLLEVTCIVRLIVQGKHTNNNSYIKLGNYDVLPVLVGKRWQNKNPAGRCAWVLPIQMTSTAYRDFTKKFYPEQIQTAAKQQTLTIGDVLKEFYPKATIVIYVFGYDAVTGARRMFQSKSYSYADIVEGKYNGQKYFKRYDDYVNHMLEIKPRHINLSESKDADIKKDSEETINTPEKNVTK